MLPYYLLIILPIIFGFSYKIRFFDLSFACKKNYCIFVFFLTLFILLSLRDISCGGDLKTYKSMFEAASKLSFKEIIGGYKVEQLYFILNRMISSIGDFQIFLTVVAAITMFPIAFFYNKESRRPYLTIILFAAVAPFSMFFSGLRQSIAMVFIVPAWYFAKGRHIFKFIITVIIACLFHQSALIMLVIYPLWHVKITKNWIYFVTPLMILGFLYKNVLFGFLITFLGERYIRRYNIMTETGAYAMLILFVMFAVFSYFIADEEKIDNNTLALRNFLLLSVFLQIFASLNMVAMRFNYYFMILLPITIPNIIEYSKRKYRNVAELASIIMIIFFAIYFIVNGYTGEDILEVFPYVPFWKG